MNRRLLFPSLAGWIVAGGLAALAAVPAPAVSEVVALGPEITVRRVEVPPRKDIALPFAVAAHSDGSVDVAWGEGEFGVPRVLLRRFDGAGEADRPIVIDAARTNLGFSMAPDPQGGLAVVWTRIDGVQARLVAPLREGGAPGPVMKLLDTGREAAVARVGGGRFAVAVRIFDPSISTSRYAAIQFNGAGPIDGSAASFGFLGAGSPALVAGPAGDLTLVTARYTRIEEEGKLPRGDTDVVAERLAAGSEGPGRRFAVSRLDRNLDETDPRAALLPNGEMVVVWARTKPEYSIFMRRFSAAGVPRTPVLRITREETDGWAGSPDVAADRNGRIVVVWAGEDGISGQRFDAAGRPIGDRFRVSDVAARPGVSLAPSCSRFAVAWKQAAPGGYKLVVRRFAVS